MVIWLCWFLGHDWRFHTPTHSRVCARCGFHECRGPAMGGARIGKGHTGW